MVSAMLGFRILISDCLTARAWSVREAGKALVFLDLNQEHMTLQCVLKLEELSKKGVTEKALEDFVRWVQRGDVLSTLRPIRSGFCLTLFRGRGSRSPNCPWRIVHFGRFPAHHVLALSALLAQEPEE